MLQYNEEEGLLHYVRASYGPNANLLVHVLQQVHLKVAFGPVTLMDRSNCCHNGVSKEPDTVRA